MPRSRQYLKDRVAARVDEIIPTGDSVGGQTAIESPMETIDDELDFSALYVLRTGSLNIVYPAVVGDLKHFHGDGEEDVDTRIVIDSITKKSTIPCPDDFLRFVSMRLSGWSSDLKELSDPRDPSYRHQEYNSYTAGNTKKPTGYLVSFTSYISAELTKWTITQTLASNETLSALFNGETPASAGATALATNDIIALTGQTDYNENGLYQVNASGEPTKISDETTNNKINCNQAVEVYRAATNTDTISHFHYIPKLKAEEIPDELVDALIEHCAGRVFDYMQNTASAEASYRKANFLLGNMGSGLKGEK